MTAIRSRRYGGWTPRQFDHRPLEELTTRHQSDQTPELSTGCTYVGKVRAPYELSAWPCDPGRQGHISRYERVVAISNLRLFIIHYVYRALNRIERGSGHGMQRISASIPRIVSQLSRAFRTGCSRPVDGDPNVHSWSVVRCTSYSLWQHAGWENNQTFVFVLCSAYQQYKNPTPILLSVFHWAITISRSGAMGTGLNVRVGRTG